MSSLLDPETQTDVVSPLPTESALAEKEPEQPTQSTQTLDGKEEAAPRFNWYVIFWIGLLHVGALAAPFYFTWSGLALCVFLHWLNGSIGICLGYHRLLTHGSFQTYSWVRWLLAACGGLAGEGSALFWVAMHRKHHAFSDQEGDPHSPHDGAWWSHMLWLFPGETSEFRNKLFRKWAPDLLKDPMLRFLDMAFLPIQLLFALAVFGLGYALGGMPMAISWVVWGVFLRLVLVLHTTWLVNSASHMWGYRNYQTTDDSRNNWFVAIIAYGEGWHNNHHAHPRMAMHGHRWWEFDLTHWVICGMEKCGLAWKVCRKMAPQHRSEEKIAA